MSKETKLTITPTQQLFVSGKTRPAGVPFEARDEDQVDNLVSAGLAERGGKKAKAEAPAATGERAPGIAMSPGGEQIAAPLQQTLAAPAGDEKPGTGTDPTGAGAATLAGTDAGQGHPIGQPGDDEGRVEVAEGVRTPPRRKS